MGDLTDVCMRWVPTCMGEVADKFNSKTGLKWRNGVCARQKGRVLWRPMRLVVWLAKVHPRGWQPMTTSSKTQPRR